MKHLLLFLLLIPALVKAQQTSSTTAPTGSAAVTVTYRKVGTDSLAQYYTFANGIYNYLPTATNPILFRAQSSTNQIQAVNAAGYPVKLTGLSYSTSGDRFNIISSLNVSNAKTVIGSAATYFNGLLIGISDSGKTVMLGNTNNRAYIDTVRRAALKDVLLKNGNQTITGDLTVTGTTTTNAAVVTNNLSVGGDLGLTHATFQQTGYKLFNGGGTFDIDQPTNIYYNNYLSFGNTAYGTIPTDESRLQYNTGGGFVIKTENGANQYLFKAGAFYINGSPVATKAHSDSVYAKKDTAHVGDIFNRRRFNDLSDFMNGGGYTAANGNILMPANETGYLSLISNYNTALNTCVLHVVYTATNNVKDANGFQFGFKSLNPNAQISNYVHLVETGANAGKIAITSSFDATTSYSTGGLAAYNAGDIIDIKIDQKVGMSYVLTVSDLTLGTTYSYTLVIPTDGTGGQSFLHNTAAVTILGNNSAAAYKILQIQYSSTLKKGGLFDIGDSLTFMFNQGYTSNFAKLMGASTQAGVGDRSQEVVLRLNELINVLSPKKVGITTGTNNGPSDIAQWKLDIATITSSLNAAKIPFFINAPFPNNTNDMSGFLAYLQAQYPTVTIDTYTPLKATSGTGLNPIYTNGDPIHINAAGGVLVAATDMASPLYSLPTPYLKLDSTILNPVVAAPGVETSVIYKKNGNLYGSPNFTYDGSLVTLSDGAQGLRAGAYAGGSGYGAIYPFGVVPGSGNYALAANNTATIINGSSQIGFNINGNAKINITSSGISALDNFTAPLFITSGGTLRQVVTGTGTLKGLTNFRYDLVGTTITNTAAGVLGDVFADGTGTYIWTGTNTVKRLLYDPTF